MATPDDHPTPSHRPERRISLGYWLAGRVAIGMMLIAVIATTLTALALLIWGGYDTYRFLHELITDGSHVTRDHVLLWGIEIVDTFLLATVVQVVGLGLYQLYFNQDLKLPLWLKIDTLDDLKSKLVGVTITVLAVFFLGKCLTWENEPSIVYLGGAVALIIGALTWFLSKIDTH